MYLAIAVALAGRAEQDSSVEEACIVLFQQSNDRPDIEPATIAAQEAREKSGNRIDAPVNSGEDAQNETVVLSVRLCWKCLRGSRKVGGHYCSAIERG